MENELLILVDENDQEIGFKDKLSTHLEGLLHRAFSVFIFNSQNELLLQQRSKDKYHSGGLWSNTCCSHPNNLEQFNDTISRRLFEEMKLVAPFHYKFKFIYKADFENGLTEYEMDHVFFGSSDEKPMPDQAEVQDWKYINLEELEKDIFKNPNNYSAWLKICLPQVIKQSKQNISQ